MRIGKILLALLLCLAAIPNVNAATPVSNTGTAEHCADYTIVRIVGLIDSGDFIICIVFNPVAASSTATTNALLRFSGPDNAAAAFTFTFTTGTFNGCTVSNGGPSVFQNGATSGGSMIYNITMTSASCYGFVRLKISTAAINTVVDHISIIHINIPEARVDQANRECSASAFDTTCAAIQFFYDFNGGILFWFVIILAFVFWIAWRKSAHLPYGLCALAFFLIGTFNGRYAWTSSTQIGLVCLTLTIGGQIVLELLRIIKGGNIKTGVGQ